MKSIILLLTLVTMSLANNIGTFKAYVFTKDDGSYYLPVIMKNCKPTQINWPDGRFTTISGVLMSSSNYSGEWTYKFNITESNTNYTKRGVSNIILPTYYKLIGCK